MIREVEEVEEGKDVEEAPERRVNYNHADCSEEAAEVWEKIKCDFTLRRSRFSSQEE